MTEAEAVEAAARALYERHYPTGVSWDQLDEGWRATERDIVRPVVEAAAPYLATPVHVAPDERTIRIAARQTHPELDGLSIARHDAFVAGARWATSAQEGGPRRPGFPWEQATREPWLDDDETKENNHD